MKVFSFISLVTIITLQSLLSEVLPVLRAVLPDVKIVEGGEQVISLNAHFGMETIDSQKVRFTSNQPDGSGGFQSIDFTLFSTATPLTRSNFLNYVNDGDYDNSIIHRSLQNFVIQGGGFSVDDSGGSLEFSAVPTDAPVRNEYAISNTYGTISMAKNAGSPDSATSQWFVSLGDNSDNLDNQNGGFTVFGRITRDSLESAELWNNSTNYPNDHNELFDDADPIQGAFGNLPLHSAYTSGSIVENDLIKFTSVELVPLEVGDAGNSTLLTYAIVSNSNPTVVSAGITAGNLTIEALSGLQGTAQLTVSATDSVGNVIMGLLHSIHKT